MATLAFDPAAAEVRISEGPAFTDGGKLLVVSGSLSGLGDRNTTIVAESNATMVVLCRGPKGQVVKREKNVPARMHFEQKIDAEMIAGGSAAFFLTSSPPPPGKLVCGRNLMTVVEDVRFKTVSLVIYQNGVVVFRQEFKK